jgi:hypothetical protein
MLKIKFSITPSKHTNLKMKVFIESFELLRISNSLKFLITLSKHTLRGTLMIKHKIIKNAQQMDLQQKLTAHAHCHIKIKMELES